MNETRSGEMVSAQIGKMGLIDELESKDFSLSDGQCFNIKNDGTHPVELEVQLAGMEKGKFVKTYFDVGWNPEIVKVVKKDSQPSINIKWGY